MTPHTRAKAGHDAAVKNTRAIRNPLVLVSQWRIALAECGAALEWMAEEESLDGHHLALVGYSMGSFNRRDGRRDERSREGARARRRR